MQIERRRGAGHLPQLGWERDSYRLSSGDGTTYHAYESLAREEETSMWVVFRWGPDDATTGKLGHVVGKHFPDLDAALDWCMDDAGEPWL